MWRLGFEGPRGSPSLKSVLQRVDRIHMHILYVAFEPGGGVLLRILDRGVLRRFVNPNLI